MAVLTLGLSRPVGGGCLCLGCCISTPWLQGFARGCCVGRGRQVLLQLVLGSCDTVAAEVACRRGSKHCHSYVHMRACMHCRRAVQLGVLFACLVPGRRQVQHDTHCLAYSPSQRSWGGASSGLRGSKRSKEWTCVLIVELTGYKWIPLPLGDTLTYGFVLVGQPACSCCGTLPLFKSCPCDCGKLQRGPSSPSAHCNIQRSVCALVPGNQHATYPWSPPQQRSVFTTHPAVQCCWQPAQQPQPAPLLCSAPVPVP